MTTVHMHATKDWLKQQIRKYGAADVLDDFKGTNAEALAAVDAMETEYVQLCKCPGSTDGRCPRWGSK